MTAFLVQGMCFGDESKGATTDKLCREFPVDLVVRYNGGCQAGHSVVLANGSHHCFSQFGAGMLAHERVNTYLSEHVLINPQSMMHEADALSKLTPNVWERTKVNGNAVIVTPIHKHLNRLREEAREVKHGSCGMGIGVARELHLKYGDQVILAKDLKSEKLVLDKIRFLMAATFGETYELEEKLKGEFPTQEVAQWCYDAVNWPATIVDGFEPSEYMVFEGAQGVMLDEKHGTAPHNTWTNTTFDNADDILDSVGIRDRIRIGCLRTYMTRHGQGPLPTEDSSLFIPEPHNTDDGYQGNFRRGAFDLKLATKAINIVGSVDYLAISHMDHLAQLGWADEDFREYIEENLGPIGMLGYGPTAEDRSVYISDAVQVG